MGTKDDLNAKVVAERLGTLHFGNFELRDLKLLCDTFNISRGTATRLCHSLKIPLFYIGKSALYNQMAFEKIIYTLTRYGGPGFAAPGSQFKWSGQYRNTSAGKPLCKVTDELLAKAEDPCIFIEMLAAGGRSSSAAKSLAEVIKKLGSKKKTLIASPLDELVPKDEPDNDTK